MKKKLTWLLLVAGLTSMVQAETINILFLYTDPAAEETGNIDTKINNLLVRANRVYRDNELEIKLKKAATKRVSKKDLEPTDDTLSLIQESEIIHEYRDEYEADLVVLLGTSHVVEETEDTISYVCGIAYLGWVDNKSTYWSNKHAYSISSVDCGYSTFVHELGHNMGLAHSKIQGDTTGGAFKDGMGHGVKDSFATIMAYPYAFGEDAIKLDYFSDPDFDECNGHPCGEEGVSDAYYALHREYKKEGKSVIGLIADYR